MKRVRMLLRVSSGQQLEADGDLSVQRRILKEYIKAQPDWVLDEKEYFEGSKSAFKNTAEEREVLQEILKDAKDGAFDILVPYKDDRVGRLLLDSTAYVVALKQYRVDIYTVKDGCISPKSIDDINGMMMLMFRFANAQKSSLDTGMRVKDTAKKLVESGKFMGGRAPYGYKLALSGEISKHGRALHELVPVPQEVQLVRYIYELSLTREYGSAKIAKTLNKEEVHKKAAPGGVWKAGTITGILTNPIYAGYPAYKRRECIDGRCHRMEEEAWILAEKPKEELVVIDPAVWRLVQEKRKSRREKFAGKKESPVIGRNEGTLVLNGLFYCGYCGGKMENATRYSYWTLQKNGEKRSRKKEIYRCQGAKEGILHEQGTQYTAEQVEPVIFEVIARCIDVLCRDIDGAALLKEKQEQNAAFLQAAVHAEEKELKKLEQKLELLENAVPDAMAGSYPLSLEELASLLKKQKEKCVVQQKITDQKRTQYETAKRACKMPSAAPLPPWGELFLRADSAAKRVVLHKLIRRIEVRQGELVVEMKMGGNQEFF